MSRIEASYKAVQKKVRAAYRGEKTQPRYPVVALTAEGFNLCEEDLYGTNRRRFTVNTNLYAEGDVQVAELVDILDWLEERYTEGDGHTVGDWERAVKLVESGASFALLFPWAKAPKRPKEDLQFEPKPEPKGGQTRFASWRLRLPPGASASVGVICRRRRLRTSG